MKYLWNERCINFVERWKRLSKEPDLKNLVEIIISEMDPTDWKPRLSMKELNDRFNMRFSHPRVCNDFISAMLHTYFTKAVWKPEYGTRERSDGKDCMTYSVADKFLGFADLCAKHLEVSETILNTNYDGRPIDDAIEYSSDW